MTTHFSLAEYDRSRQILCATDQPGRTARSATVTHRPNSFDRRPIGRRTSPHPFSAAG